MRRRGKREEEEGGGEGGRSLGYDVKLIRCCPGQDG